jgi:DNA polymerase-3 subunit epsilon
VGAGVKSGVAADTPAPKRPELYDFSVFNEMERHVPAAMRERRLDQVTFVVLDTETTGLRPEGGDRIISLAGVRVRSGLVRPSEVFDALVCPERSIPSSSTRLHGITDDMVVSAPAIGVVLPAFLRFCEGAVLAGHEVSFDLGFLRRDMEFLGLPRLTSEHPVLDTRLLSRLVHGTDADHTIEAVAQRLGVRTIGRHSALGDALTTAEILVRLLQLLNRRGLATLGQILDALRRATPRG